MAAHSRAYLLEIVSGNLSLGRNLQRRLHVQRGVLIRSVKVLCLYEHTLMGVSAGLSGSSPHRTRNWMQTRSTDCTAHSFRHR